MPGPSCSAYFLNVVISAIGLTAAITDLVTALDPTPMQLLASIILFYLILGFMETLSMMVATVPITTPLIVGAGYDPIWYGVLVVILMETAMVPSPSLSKSTSDRRGGADTLSQPLIARF